MPVYKKILYLLIICIITAPIGCSSEDDFTEGYWIWAGIHPDDYELEGTLYIYQGLFEPIGSTVVFNKRGLYPYPLNSDNIYLVFRLRGIKDGYDYTDVILYWVEYWNHHKINVQGIQIDFDAPTARLEEYRAFLRQFRKQLPEEYRLSITGLADWAASGSVPDLQKIAEITDEIVFQLYARTEHFPDAMKYVDILGKLPFSFRVGLLPGKADTELLKAELMNMDNCNGVLYFLQNIKENGSKLDY